MDPGRADLSVRRQCELITLHRSTYYYKAALPSGEDLELMAVIDRAFTDDPALGTRRMAVCLQRQGYPVGRRRVRRLMHLMGLQAVYQVPRTSVAHPAHEKYPYLLRNVEITRPNQVWCADITYLPMRRGFLYLVAVMDWYSRMVLSWRVSNTMDTSFCVEALQEALCRYGSPEIFNTDQGSQFTDRDFIAVLKDVAGLQISMDGRGRWLDNVMIERLWRSLKYETIYLHAWETGTMVRHGIERWMHRYCFERPHGALMGRTPHEAYRGISAPEKPVIWPVLQRAVYA